MTSSLTGRVFFAGLALLLAAPAVPSLAQAPQEKVHTLDSVDQPPKLKKALKIKYPYEVRRQGGEVVLRFTITAQGRVQELTVMNATNPDMIPAVCAAYESAEFAPAQKDGKPVAVSVEITERRGK